MDTLEALPEHIKQVSVSAFAKPAGEINQPAQFSFQYSQPNPVSLTMDYQTDAIHYGVLHPVFQQNLPEGYVRRYIEERLLRYAKVNDLYLLALQGSGGIGHLTYYSILDTGKPEQLSLNDILDWNESDAIFPQLLERYYLHGMTSGIQPKVMVPVTGKAAITQESLIVKTFDEEYELLTVNEYVCMQAARSVGLNPPRCWLSEDLRSFVIDRFDVKRDVKTKVENQRRMAVEDFTVLMKKSGSEKYSSSYEMLLKATGHYTRSPEEVERMYRYIVFNCLVGNGDAHLKNFSVIYDQNRESIRLSPPYDITHTLIYPTIDNRMALKMAGSKVFPNYRTLERLGLDYGVRQACGVIEEIADGLSDFIVDCEQINLIEGFRASLLSSLSCGTTRGGIGKNYRHDKKRKFE